MEARKVDEELSARARGGRLMLVKEHAPMMSAVPRRKRSALDTLSFYNEREVGEGMFRMLDGWMEVEVRVFLRMKTMSIDGKSNLKNMIKNQIFCKNILSRLLYVICRISAVTLIIVDLNIASAIAVFGSFIYFILSRIWVSDFENVSVKFVKPAFISSIIFS